MPVKRRVEKRRLDAAAMLNLLSDPFDHGAVTFDDDRDALAAMGAHCPLSASLAERPAADAAWRAAIGAFWTQYGAAYLAAGGSGAWALGAFGRPPHAR